MCPLAIVETIRGVRLLLAVCRLATGLGLYAGQTLAEATAICPQLETADADLPADQAALAALAAWCERYTPLAATNPPDGLWLDITGCDHLQNSEAGLAADLMARMAKARLLCHIAIADTAGAAWALARATTDTITIQPPGTARAGLAPLPVPLLRIAPRTASRLRRLGLRRVGELARLPRAELAARFGPEPGLRLDQAFGDAAEAISWPRPTAPWSERLAFVEPIGTADDLARALTVLTGHLCARLAAKTQGGQRFVATFHRVDGQRPQIVVATARPVRDTGYVAKLLAARIETVDPGFGIDAIVLEVPETATLPLSQTKIDAVATDTGLAAAIDQLANRPDTQLWRSTPHPSHVPERALRRILPITVSASWRITDDRPVRMFRPPQMIDVTAPVPDDPPLLFRWRGALHKVRAASGPERISAEWWRLRRVPTDATTVRPETDHVRDYYRVEDNAGARFWIFRAGLHHSAARPRWYLHGMFG